MRRVGDLLLLGSCCATRLQPLRRQRGHASGNAPYGAASSMFRCIMVRRDTNDRNTMIAITVAGCHSPGLGAHGLS